jgi:hypothetical protein
MEALGNDSTMRTMFDCLCAEWEFTTLDEKVNAFHIFKRHGYSVGDVAEMFQARFAKSVKHDYIMQDMPQAVELLYNHAIAVGDAYVKEGLEPHRSAFMRLREKIGQGEVVSDEDWTPKTFFSL